MMHKIVVECALIVLLNGHSSVVLHLKFSVLSNSTYPLGYSLAYFNRPVHFVELKHNFSFTSRVRFDCALLSAKLPILHFREMNQKLIRTFA